MRTDNKNKDFLIIGKGPTPELDYTTLTEEAEYSINFSRSNRKFCLILYYNASNSFLFVNTTKDSETKKYPLCLGNISKDFISNNMKKNRIKWMCLRIFC